MAKVWLNIFDRPINSLDPEKSPGAPLIHTGAYPGTAFFSTKELANAIFFVPEVIEHNLRHKVKRIGCIEVDVPDELLGEAS